MNLRNLQKTACENFLESLCKLDDDLECKMDVCNNINLENFTQKYKIFKNSMTILLNKKVKTENFTVNINEFGIKEITIDANCSEDENRIFFSYQNRIIDVKPKELASLYVNLSEQEAFKKLNLFFDYENRCCDYCGYYFDKYDNSSPVNRKQMEDFISAYHSNCYKNNL